MRRETGMPLIMNRCTLSRERGPRQSAQTKACMSKSRSSPCQWIARNGLDWSPQDSRSSDQLESFLPLRYCVPKLPKRWKNCIFYWYLPWSYYLAPRLILRKERFPFKRYNLFRPAYLSNIQYLAKFRKRGTISIAVWRMESFWQ